MMIEKDFLINEEEEEAGGLKQFSILTRPITPNIKSLCLDWQEHTLQIPKFQRRFVWSLKQCSLFIESLMLELPIPTLMFFVDEYANNLIIDGQQRMKSILYFTGTITKDESPVKEQKYINFRLTGLSPNSPWYNKKFSEFSDIDKKKFRDRSLDIKLISLKNPKDLTSIFYIFERLNTGGTILNAQEIRNCIYSGPFNDFLVEINKYPNWRKIFTSDEDECRQRDVEIILRFFALYDSLENYKRPMKDFLSQYMNTSTIRYMSKEDMEVKETLFKKTVDAIINNLGEKPFHIKNGLNSAVCDSVMLAFAGHLENIPHDILERYDKLKKDNTYYKYVGKSVNDVNSVIERIRMADDILFGTHIVEKSKVIKLFEIPVSAGTGNWMNDDSIPYEELEVLNTKADFAVIISGDSMEPEYHDKDVLIVKAQKIIASGKVGIFCYKNKVYCKRYLKSKSVFLMSKNPHYNPIRIEDPMQFYVNGEVIGVIGNKGAEKKKTCITCGEPSYLGSDYCWEHYKYHHYESK